MKLLGSVGLLLALLPAGHESSAAPSSEVGRWTAPFSEDVDGDGHGEFDERPPRSRSESAQLPVAVNTVVLTDGRVLYWSQLEGTEAADASIAFELPEPARSRSRILDLSGYFASETAPHASAWSVPAPEDGGAGDLVGSEQRHLPDGRVLAIGGTEWAADPTTGLPSEPRRTELYGLRDARLFDPRSGSWSAAQPMRRRRYYPTLVTMPDGRLVAVGGAERLIYNSAAIAGAHHSSQTVPHNVRTLETFDSSSGEWTVDARSGSEAVLPLLARLHLLPNGKLLYPAAGMLYAPGGGDSEAERWNVQQWFDPDTGAWEDVGRAPLGVRSNAFSVLLRLEPPYTRATVLLGGGTLGPWPSGYLATPLTEVVTWEGTTVRRAPAPPLTAPRWHSSAVVLPSGEVVVLSGADRDEVVDPGSAIAVRHAEMFDPVEQRWVGLASAARDRTIHNTAVLLKDGSILVGGHAPAPAHYGSHRSNPPPFANNFKDPSFEIFRPPYLFRGSRPMIKALSSHVVRLGTSLEIATPDAADPSLTVVLVRLPATTHVNDADQRSVVLEHDVRGDDTVAASIPASAAVVPPGHYYVFLVKDSGEGPTPSIAEIARIER